MLSLAPPTLPLVPPPNFVKIADISKPTRPSAGKSTTWVMGWVQSVNARKQVTLAGVHVCKTSTPGARVPHYSHFKPAAAMLGPETDRALMTFHVPDETITELMSGPFELTHTLRICMLLRATKNGSSRSAFSHSKSHDAMYYPTIVRASGMLRGHDADMRREETDDGDMDANMSSSDDASDSDQGSGSDSGGGSGSEGSSNSDGDSGSDSDSGGSSSRGSNSDSRSRSRSGSGSGSGSDSDGSDREGDGNNLATIRRGIRRWNGGERRTARLWALRALRSRAALVRSLLNRHATGAAEESGEPRASGTPPTVSSPRRRRDNFTKRTYVFSGCSLFVSQTRMAAAASMGAPIPCLPDICTVLSRWGAQSSVALADAARVFAAPGVDPPVHAAGAACNAAASDAVCAPTPDVDDAAGLARWVQHCAEVPSAFKGFLVPNMILVPGTHLAVDVVSGAVVSLADVVQRGARWAQACAVGGGILVGPPASGRFMAAVTTAGPTAATNTSSSATAACHQTTTRATGSHHDHHSFATTSNAVLIITSRVAAARRLLQLRAAFPESRVVSVCNFKELEATTWQTLAEAHFVLTTSKFLASDVYLAHVTSALTALFSMPAQVLEALQLAHGNQAGRRQKTVRRSRDNGSVQIATRVRRSKPDGAACNSLRGGDSDADTGHVRAREAATSGYDAATARVHMFWCLNAALSGEDDKQLRKAQLRAERIGTSVPDEVDVLVAGSVAAITPESRACAAALKARRSGVMEAGTARIPERHVAMTAYAASSLRAHLSRVHPDFWQKLRRPILEALTFARLVYVDCDRDADVLEGDRVTAFGAATKWLTLGPTQHWDDMWLCTLPAAVTTLPFAIQTQVQFVLDSACACVPRKHPSEPAVRAYKENDLLLRLREWEGDDGDHGVGGHGGYGCLPVWPGVVIDAVPMTAKEDVRGWQGCEDERSALAAPTESVGGLVFMHASAIRPYVQQSIDKQLQTLHSSIQAKEQLLARICAGAAPPHQPGVVVAADSGSTPEVHANADADVDVDAVEHDHVAHALAAIRADRGSDGSSITSSSSSGSSAVGEADDAGEIADGINIMASIISAMATATDSDDEEYVPSSEGMSDEGDLLEDPIDLSSDDGDLMGMERAHVRRSAHQTRTRRARARLLRSAGLSIADLNEEATTTEESSVGAEDDAYVPSSEGHESSGNSSFSEEDDGDNDDSGGEVEQPASTVRTRAGLGHRTVRQNASDSKLSDADGGSDMRERESKDDDNNDDGAGAASSGAGATLNHGTHRGEEPSRNDDDVAASVAVPSSQTPRSETVEEEDVDALAQLFRLYDAEASPDFEGVPHRITRREASSALIHKPEHVMAQLKTLRGRLHAAEVNKETLLALVDGAVAQITEGTTLCDACCTRPVNAVLRDCGHGACHACLEYMRKDSTRRCMICRKNIELGSILVANCSPSCLPAACPLPPSFAKSMPVPRAQAVMCSSTARGCPTATASGDGQPDVAQAREADEQAGSVNDAVTKLWMATKHETLSTFAFWLRARLLITEASPHRVACIVAPSTAAMETLYTALRGKTALPVRQVTGVTQSCVQLLQAFAAQECHLVITQKAVLAGGAPHACPVVLFVGKDERVEPCGFATPELLDMASQKKLHRLLRFQHLYIYKPVPGHLSLLNLSVPKRGARR